MAPFKHESRARTTRRVKTMQMDSQIAEARLAVEMAAKKAFWQAQHSEIAPAFSASPTSKRRVSIDSSSSKASNSSFQSHERAMDRGSHLGLFELPDSIGQMRRKKDKNNSYSEEESLDLEPIILESRMTTSLRNGNQRKDTRMKKKSKPAKLSFLRKPFRTKNSRLHYLTSEISKEAWMCGVCAKSFSSFEAAQRHEDDHIREVVMDLGWGHNPALHDRESVVIPTVDWEAQPTGTDHSQDTGLPTSSVPTTPERDPKENRDFSSVSSTPQRPRPDMLRMHNQATPLHSCNGFSANTAALKRKYRRCDSESSSADVRFHHEDILGSERQGFLDDYRLDTPMMHNYSNKRMSPIMERRDRKGQDSTPDSGFLSDEHDLLVPHGIRDFVVLADEALCDVCTKAETLILTDQEREAEKELEYLARDKAYYDLLHQRSLERFQGGNYNQFRTEGKSILSKVQNKFIDAYQLIKEGKRKKSNSLDHYNRKRNGDGDTIHLLENNKQTLYVNVIVKASLKVVRNELQRMAKERWEAELARTKNGTNTQAKQFEQFRALAQDNLVKLAGLALASDFTPSRIAIQLSNDLYRLLTPRLKKRGVLIETDIEYRVGPYFVLAVNVMKVDWRRQVRAAYRDVAVARSKWKKEQEEKDDDKSDVKSEGIASAFLSSWYGLTKLTEFEVIAQFLAWCYYLPWFVYTPICIVLYHTLLGEMFRRYFLATVSDEIFYYVEKKGMEMDIGIRTASKQAAFMLSALREIRADGREQKKKQEQGDNKSSLLGPLLGPAIKEDSGPAPQKPEGFEIPENLEYIGLDLDLPVGFRRLRWALLSTQSDFVIEAVFRTESKYDNIQTAPWSKYDEYIGLPTLPEGITEENIMTAERETKYLMPKSVFVKANMCTETAYIDAYNDYCFVLRKKALTPEVPYGTTFVAWTKYVVINTGSDSCKIICSVEAEFPNGPPMISRQIKGGMRAGVTELFVKTGETINKYADEYP